MSSAPCRGWPIPLRIPISNTRHSLTRKNTSSPSATRGIRRTSPTLNTLPFLPVQEYLLDDLAQESPRQIILEIDPVIDEISRRRLHFYLRNGFVANEQYDYIHPPYKTGDKPYPLLLMSSGAPLSEPLYHLFTDYHHHVVVPALPEQP